MDSLKGLTGMERIQRQTRVIYEHQCKLSDTSQSIEARVSSLFKGNQFLFLFTSVIKMCVLLVRHLKVWESLAVILTTGNGHVTPATFLFFVYI